MILDPSIAIQRAIFTALSSNTALVASLGTPGPGIFDRPPAGATLPWIILGQDEIRDDSADDSDGAEVTAILHVFGDGNLSAVKMIAAQAAKIIAAPLDLSADNQRCITALLESIRPLSDPDGETWHVVITVTYLTEPTA